MDTFAYCAESFRRSVEKAAGCHALTCPPMTADAFHPWWMSRHEFIYFKLHGLPGQPFWYGDDWITAVTAEQIRASKMAGTVVFVANCHLTPDGEEAPQEVEGVSLTPMLDALLVAGARAVVGGPGINYAKARSVDGADLLGQTFRRCVAMGLSPETAFGLARLRLKVRLRQGKAISDALGFRLFEPGRET